MMKLKNMIKDTHHPAQEFLNNWNYDRNSLVFLRASSNYVYVFKYNGEKYYLRFVHEEDNTLKQINGELEFLNYLYANKYPCAIPIKSKKNNFVERVSWGTDIYYGVVFSEAKGVSLDIGKMNEKQFQAWGKALGELHHLSGKYYSIDHNRKSYREVLEYIRNILLDFPGEVKAMEELERVKRWLKSIPITGENYGLIHYDFELDNVFWNEKLNTFSVIDFDDTLYHWHVMDIVYALRDLNDLSEADAKVGFNAFLKGYGSIMYLGEDEIALMPRFERFSNLYSFARIMRSMKDSKFENEPTWLTRLRPHLEKKCSDYRESFNVPW